MHGRTDDAQANPTGHPLLGRAARIEDRVQQLRERFARRRGRATVVVPYAGYGRPGWVRVLGRVLLTDEDLTDPDRVVRGWRSFTAVPVNDVVVVVTIEGVEHRVRADRGGIVDVRLEASFGPGRHTVRLRAEDPQAVGSEEVEADVFVIDVSAGFGIVSDIDDTVMVTALPRPFLAAWNSFVIDEHARTPTPGMAVLYDRLQTAHPETPVLYLSTGAWNTAPTLGRFLGRNLYPTGPMLLTDWGATPDRIFRSGRAHKESQLRRLAEEFPDVRWLLIGDDGQHDEAIYGEFALAHPENIAAVCIRSLSPGEAVFAGGRSKDGRRYGSRVDAPWITAPDGAGLAGELERIGLL